LKARRRATGLKSRHRQTQARRQAPVGGEAAQAGKTAGAGAEAAEKIVAGAEAAVGVERRVGRRRGGGKGGGVEHKDAAGDGVVSTGGGGLERFLEEVRREFSGLPVYVGVGEGGYV